MKRLAVPRSAIVRHLLALMDTERRVNGHAGLKAMSDRAGVSMHIIKGWYQGYEPKISDAEAVANACGKTLVFMDLDTPPK